MKRMLSWSGRFVSECLGIKGVLNLFESLYAHGTDKSPANTSEYCFAGWKQCLFNCLFYFSLGDSCGWGWRRRIQEFCTCLVSSLHSVKQSLKLFCCSLWLKRSKGLSTWASNFFLHFCNIQRPRSCHVQGPVQTYSWLLKFLEQEPPLSEEPVIDGSGERGQE